MHVKAHKKNVPMYLKSEHDYPVLLYYMYEKPFTGEVLDVGTFNGIF